MGTCVSSTPRYAVPGYTAVLRTLAAWDMLASSTAASLHRPWRQAPRGMLTAPPV